MLSAGSDRTIRLWNYKSKTCELVHALTDNPLSIALHPMGYQCILSFKEYVRVCHLVHGDIRTIRSFALKHCYEVEYSHGGHLIACAVGITVLVYRNYSFECLYSLTGHIEPVRRLVFAADDQYLYSAGLDGAIYGWNLLSGVRLDQIHHVNRNVKYYGLVVDPSQPERLVVGGSDGILREIISGEETLTLDITSGVPFAPTSGSSSSGNGAALDTIGTS